jgi:ADP-ribosylglycohydrolase
MRIIPVSIRFAGAPIKECLDRAHRASGITHRHPRAQMACGFHSLMIRELLSGFDAGAAFARALQTFRDYYEADPYWRVELDQFQLLLAGDLTRRPESEIGSSGYVIQTLTASLWCLLTTATYEDCVLKAVNLGGDTDTTGCVAGGLAGVLYGEDAIPQRWRDALARKEELAQLFHQFAALLER